MTDQTTHDAVLAALDTWAQDWHRRHSNGASPAQPADNALLAAYDAHRAPTTTVRPLPTRDDLADDGIRWNTNATDYLHNLADRRLAAIRDLQRRSSDNLADADEARRERDILIDAIARMISLPPEQVAKAYSVRYDGPVLPDDYCPDGPHGTDDDEEQCGSCGWQATP